MFPIIRIIIRSTRTQHLHFDSSLARTSQVESFLCTDIRIIYQWSPSTTLFCLDVSHLIQQFTRHSIQDLNCEHRRIFRSTCCVSEENLIKDIFSFAYMRELRLEYDALISRIHINGKRTAPRLSSYFRSMVSIHAIHPCHKSTILMLWLARETCRGRSHNSIITIIDNSKIWVITCTIRGA